MQFFSSCCRAKVIDVRRESGTVCICENCRMPAVRCGTDLQSARDYVANERRRIEDETEERNRRESLFFAGVAAVIMVIVAGFVLLFLAIGGPR